MSQPALTRISAMALPLLTSFALQAGETSPVAPLQQVLSQHHDCSPTITIRSQALTKEQITQACTLVSP